MDGFTGSTAIALPTITSPNVNNTVAIKQSILHGSLKEFERSTQLFSACSPPLLNEDGKMEFLLHSSLTSLDGPQPTKAHKAPEFGHTQAPPVSERCL